MKKILTGFFVLLVLMFNSITYASATRTIRESNNLFCLILPRDIKGTYSVRKNDSGILIYDKVSKKAGFGGYAFGVRLFKKPSDYAMSPGCKKLGEFVDKYGRLYDVVLNQPTDVQYDYVTGNSATYYPLYHLANSIGNNIEAKSYNKYLKGQGTCGKDIYKDVINKHITAIKEKWDSKKLESENMSYMYNVLASENQNVLDKVGYAFYDVNGDGIEELFIGEIAQDEWKGVVYDLYTMVDRKPAHVVSGGTRDRYYVSDDAFLCNEYSSGAEENGWKIYALLENSTKLYPQVFFKYDGYKDKEHPWYMTYASSGEEWKTVSEKEFKERKEVFNKYLRFDYTPLSSWDKK